ncbi:MAG: aldehyde dehydrogenase family protein [Pseudoramibacter sp.]
MNIDTAGIEAIVKRVMSSIDEANGVAPASQGAQGRDGIFDDMEDAIAAAQAAWNDYKMRPLSLRYKIIEEIRKTFTKKETVETIVNMAVEETGMGNVPDKLKKAYLCAEKTPGMEDLQANCWTGDEGLTLLELSPFGVIGAMCPSTNPNETIVNNSISMLAAGNAIVFAPHPGALQTSLYCVRLVNQAIAAAGGPANLVVSTEHPTMESANVMMHHPDVRLLCATGGPGVVHAVLSSGKKAIGAGPGNPPALVDETADIEKAAKDIIDGCTFDNNLPCIAEKEVVVVDQVADYLIFNMKKNGAFEIKDRKVLDDLAAMVAPDGRVSRDYVGKSAKYIAKAAGIDVPEDTRVLIGELPADHPLVQIELMMPILGIVRVDNVDEGIDLACELEHGNRHTATMHSKNVDALSKMSKKIASTIFVKNGPSYAGLGNGGEGYPTFTIAGPTGEGLTSAKTFARRRRCVLCDAFNIK